MSPELASGYAALKTFVEAPKIQYVGVERRTLMQPSNSPELGHGPSGAVLPVTADTKAWNNH
jgi:hypothetical protein